ncbi:hypothetical protein SLS62_003171 [Diatrype stigma]|uniref:DNA excision repair protein ERCC-8 n=1 Tax=Diatrype stigma TaxID=117547 RepID=A0AAN9UX09_9PEZI
MNQLLFERSTGNVGPNVFARLQTTQLVSSFRPAPHFRFDGGERGTAIHDGEAGPVDSSPGSHIWSHQAGVSALALERFEGRILISGGSDASVKVWDLEQCGNPSRPKLHTYKPIARITRSAQAHKFGITHLSFYPFDAAAFLSTSYDQTLKSLAGHHGAVLATSWSPRHEHVLATGSVDGTVRIWDIRRAGGALGMLDQEDSLGLHYNGLLGQDGKARVRASAKAHAGPVNSLTWTDDGAFIISAGHDRRIRVWDAATGRNTLASFGPSIKNSQLATTTMFTTPVGVTHPGKEVLFWPNDTEILLLDLHDGHVITRLRGTGPAIAGSRAGGGAERTVKNRITSIVWRGAGGGGASSGVIMGGSNMAGAVYSAHLDGQIRAWAPHLQGDDAEAEDEAVGLEDTEAKAKKRKAIDDVFKSLMGQKITFT